MSWPLFSVSRHQLRCPWDSLADRMCWRFALAREERLGTPLRWTPGGGRPGCRSGYSDEEAVQGFPKVKPSKQSADDSLPAFFFPATLPWSSSAPGVCWPPLPQPWPPSPFLCEWFSPTEDLVVWPEPCQYLPDVAARWWLAPGQWTSTY